MVSKNRRMVELRLGKLGLILFIGGISLLLFGVFLLGVTVGKHLETYPDQYALGFPDLLRERFFPPPKGEGGGEGKPGGQGGPAEEGETFDLTFFDTLGGKKGDEAKGVPVRPAMPGPAASPASPPAPAVPSPPAGETASGAPAPAPVPDGAAILPPRTNGEGPKKGESAATGEAAPPTRKAEAPPAKGGFEVQAAAYREKARADQLVRKLAGFGFSAQVVVRDIPEKGRWYRVVAGGFENRERAQGAAERMAGKIKGLKCVVRATGKES